MRFLFLCLSVSLLYPWSLAYALPPPDLIITVLQSFMQVMGALFAMLVVVVMSTWQWLKIFYQLHKKIVWSVIVLTLVAVPTSLFVALKYEENKWKQAVQQNFLLMADEAQNQLNNTQPNSLMSETSTETLVRNKVLAELDKMAQSGSDTQTNIMDLSFAGALDYEAFKTQLLNPEAQIIDVRTALGFEKGRVKNSVNIELPDLLFGEWKTLDPNRPVVIVCYAGSSGVVVSHFLASLGFNEVYFPENGIYKYRNQLADFNFEGEYFDPYVGVQQQMVERETVLNLNAQVIDFRTKAEVENDPIGSVVTNPDISFYTTKNMTAWLDELDPNAVYALVCDSPLSCYNSAIMTYRIKQKNIELMGTIFTNGTWGAWVNK